MANVLSHTVDECRASRATAATRCRSTIFSSGLVGVSTQIIRVFGLQRRFERGRVGQIDEADTSCPAERLRTFSNSR